jgi:hypothetical protein
MPTTSSGKHRTYVLLSLSAKALSAGTSIGWAMAAQSPSRNTGISSSTNRRSKTMLLRVKQDQVQLEDGQVETLANYIKASFDAERDMKRELQDRKQGWAELASLINKEKLA